MCLVMLLLWIKKLSSVRSKSLLGHLKLAVLLFLQMSGWLNPPSRITACEHDASHSWGKNVPSTGSPWLGSLQQTQTMRFPLLVWPYKLSVCSSVFLVSPFFTVFSHWLQCFSHAIHPVLFQQQRLDCSFLAVEWVPFPPVSYLWCMHSYKGPSSGYRLCHFFGRTLLSHLLQQIPLLGSGYISTIYPSLFLLLSSHKM